MKGNKNPPEGTQAIQRVATIIRLVSQKKEGVSLSWVARKSDLSISTTHRILSALKWEGWVRFNPDSKRYFLGHELFHLRNAVSQFEMQTKFHMVLERIAIEIEDTILLLIRDGYDNLCIDLVEGRYPIRFVTFKIGRRRPLGFGAGNMALIAFLQQEEFEKIIHINEHRFHEFCKNISLDNIRNLAAVARKVGHVVSEEIFTENISAVGVPIFNKQGRVEAAISVVSIPQRMSRERQAEVAHTVKKIVEKEAIK